MSFETITIERRQPILDKRFVRVPGGENNKNLSPIPIDDAIVGIDSPTDGDDGRVQLFNFGNGKEYRDFLPFYQNHMNLDFLAYERVTTQGYPVSTGVGPVDDLQQALRDVAANV